MTDSTHAGWLAGDDYQWAAEHRPRNGPKPDAAGELGEYHGTGLPPSVALGRFEDDDPPGAPR